jgi:hypothetical protein
MKVGGSYRIYPAILSQIRNPPVLIRKFHSGIFYHGANVGKKGPAVGKRDQNWAKKDQK